MIEYLKLIRVHQWSKNIFIFAPIFFSGNLFVFDKLVHTIYGFLGYCMAASSVYIINDIIDVHKDKIHPLKKNRPYAAGKVKKSTIIVLSFILFLISFLVAYSVNTQFFTVLVIYYLINLGYTFKFKHISLLDVFIISFGFVLRIAGGGVTAGVLVSHWLYIMTFLLALFIAFAKRRDDVLILNKHGIQTRISLKGYNLEFISSVISILLSVLVVTYLLYITSPEINLRFEGKNAYISAIFVIIGVLRYLQITMVEANSGSPTKILFQDRFIQFTLLSWVMFFIILIYLV